MHEVRKKDGYNLFQMQKAAPLTERVKTQKLNMVGALGV